MKTLLSFIAFIFLPCVFISAQVNRPPVYEILTDTLIRQEIDSRYRQLLEDRNGKWTIDEVSRQPLTDNFHFTDKIEPGIDSLFKAYWFRYRIKNKMDKEGALAFSASNQTTDFYLKRQDGKWEHLVSGFFSNWNSKDGFKAGNYVPVSIKPGEELLIYQRIGNAYVNLQIPFDIALVNTDKVIRKSYVAILDDKTYRFSLNDLQGSFFIGFLFFAAFFNFFFYAVTKERLYLYFTLFVFFLSINNLNPIIQTIILYGETSLYNYYVFAKYSWSVTWIFLFLFFREAFKISSHYPKWDKILLTIFILLGLITLIRLVADYFYFVKYLQLLFAIFLLVELISMGAIVATLILYTRKKDKFTRQVLIGGMPIIFLWGIIIQFSSNSLFASVNSLSGLKNWMDENFKTMELACTVWFILFFSWFLFMRYNMLKKENAQKSIDNERLAKEKEKEKNELIAKQNAELEIQVADRTHDLKKSLDELKSTQSQLIQSEKMASLGELTAGIAHEIQNPLNFVNNFSEVSNELIDEMNVELNKGDIEEAKAISADIKQNLEKINHHGKRADAIVKGMLQHSQSSSGVKEPTNINALADEYLRLAYHGLRAKDKSFNVTLKTDFDPDIGNINIISQDIGRVLLNLINNALYAVNERSKKGEPVYVPEVAVITEREGNRVKITVKDNGGGIPESIKGKIFQPFFTTKPTGQGTGLGLSLSYDIMKAHGGELKVETCEGEGSTFIIQL